MSESPTPDATPETDDVPTAEATEGEQVDSTPGPTEAGSESSDTDASADDDRSNFTVYAQI